MSVNRDELGRKFVQTEVEVSGTPEQVWQAIATGPGISSWFVPSEVEEREGGTTVSRFFPDGSMDSVGKISVWDPPRKFVVDTPEEGGSPPIATEWIVESRDGGKCVVRVVHRWFAETDDWDGQFEGHIHGWNAFFRVLRLVLDHFPGQPSALIQLGGFSVGSKADAWSSLMGALGLSARAVGERVSTGDGVPRLGGLVERVGPVEFPEELLLLLTDPAPGVAHLFAMDMGGMVYLSLRFYLFGENATEIADRERPLWESWIAKHFPPPGA